ncbi:hypothetical protein [Microcoleus sp. A6-C5]|uniref:hypothetical protein n=1 Tax=Microcoleus sp. A6-C5 TaxID=2818547 RepID=UPI002FD2948B
MRRCANQFLTIQIQILRYFESWKKEEGRRKKEEGRGKREEGRRKREEGKN